MTPNNSTVIATGQAALNSLPTMVVVPPNIYSMDFDTVMSAPVIIKEADIGRPGSGIGDVDMNVVIDFKSTIISIKKEYGCSQKNTVATLAEYGLSILQNKHNGDLKRVKDQYETDFHSGNGRERINRLYGETFHLFPKNEYGSGSKKRIVMFGNRDKIISPIYENAEFFNMSSSDMGMIVLSYAFVKWDKLPADYKIFFEDLIQKFETHASKFYSI